MKGKKMDIKALAQKYNDFLITQRRWFHQHPEVSEKEFETSKRIKEELDKLGVAWRPCGLETGVLATIKGAHPGKTILLRGDIDALTVQEETGYEFASCNPGVMHACGHDCHISMLLTAAAMLNEIKDELHGTVVLAFQPAEEVATGAKSMIEQGCLDGVDAAFGMHVWSDFEGGKVAVRTGAAMASGDRFDIEVIGKGGHGAAPHQCVDAAVISAAIVQNLQTGVSREINPVDTAVITVGTINAGTRWNVVAGSATLTGTTRCFNRDVRDYFPTFIERVATQTAHAMRGDAKVTYTKLVPPTINDAALADMVRGSAKKVMGQDCLYDYPVTMGGEDFAYYQEKVPGVMVMLGIRSEACDAVYPQHSGHYKVDESALIKGALLHTQVAYDFLNGK